MAKLNDFIRALELCVEKDNMVPSAEEINLAIRRAAVPVVKKHRFLREVRADAGSIVVPKGLMARISEK